MAHFFTFPAPKPTVFRLLLPLFLLLFSSCEKVLDIDLNDAPPRIIIEANFNNLGDPATVLVSRSIGFNDPNTFPAIRGAQVTLTDNAGNAETLVETEAGLYQTVNLTGVPGRIYTLKVEAEGQEYTAVSEMPQPNPIQNIRVERFRFDPDRLATTIGFLDPAGVKNYYRAYYIVNDTLSDNYNFFSDEFSEAQLIEETFIDRDLELGSGDSVRVELQTLNEGVFRFLREQQLLGNPQSSSPANPKSMFTNGALGYFSAHAQTSAGTVVP